MFLNLPFIGGSKPTLSPYEETCDSNWEFDKALKSLGNKLFKEIYLDGKGKPDKKLFDEFCKILYDIGREE